MKVKTIKSIIVNGEPTNPGDVVEVSEKDGFYLINRGLAETAKEAPKPTTKAKAKK